MSDVLAHGYCAYNAITNIKNPETKRIITENISYFYLGAQGPDIFFYYNVWPWADGKDVNNLASTLHKNNTQLFLLESYDYIIALPSSEDKNILLAYLFGFLSHYALDQTTHPFIFYFSGVTDLNNPDTFRFKYEHKLFECALDTLLRDQYKASHNHHKTQHQMVKQNGAIPEAFDDYFSYIFQRVYEISIIQGCASSAAKSMYKVLKLLHDPLRIKRPLLMIIENIVGTPAAFSTAVYPSKLNPSLDYMNMQHKTWLHPCDATITSQESYLDLFHKAEDLTSNFINAFDDYSNKTIPLSALKAILGNKSYDTGQSSENRLPLKYYDSIYVNP